MVPRTTEKNNTRKTGNILPFIYTQFSFKIHTTLRLMLPLPLPLHSLARGYGVQHLSALPLPLRFLAQGYGNLEEVRKDWLVSLAETSQKKTRPNLAYPRPTHLCDSTVAFPHPFPVYM